ncbi:MAG: DUF4384 domain-containing protein [Gemmatimonadota bacterium]
MISAILPLVLSVVTASVPAKAPTPAVTGAEPAIRVKLNHQSYNRGDRARVTVRLRDDGYVLVLHQDADGHVRVLFPVDPGDDNFLKAGEEYEIRGRGDRNAFQVTTAGSGTVYAAVSMDPYRLDDFVRNNHWEYGRLGDDSGSNRDAEASMTNLVEQMANGNHFDYDVTTYTAETRYASSGGHAYIVSGSSYYGCMYGSWDPWCDGYYPSPSYFSLSIGFGGFGGYYGYRGYGYPYYSGYPYGYGYGGGYGYGYGSGYGYGGGYGYPYYGHYYRPGYSYGAAGYGYQVGHGWSYNHRPVVLGPGGAYSGGAPAWGLSSGSSLGYHNRGSFVSSRPGTSPLYGVSRFNTQRGPSRGIESPNRFGGRREIGVNEQPGYRTRIENTRPTDQTGMRPGPRNDGVGMSHANGAPTSAPTRIETQPRVEPQPRVQPQPRAEPRSEPQPRAEPRQEPRAEPRAEQRPEPRAEPRPAPRAEPRSEPREQPRAEPRSRPPERSGGGGGGFGGGGGGGGRRGGGGGGGRRP